MLFSLLSHSIAPHELSVICLALHFSTPDFFLWSGLVWGETHLVGPFFRFLKTKFCFLSPLPVRYSRLCSIGFPDQFCSRGEFLLYCLLTHKLSHPHSHSRSHPPTPPAGASSRIDRVQQFLGRPSSSQSQSGEPSPELCVAVRLSVCLCAWSQLAAFISIIIITYHLHNQRTHHIPASIYYVPIQFSSAARLQYPRQHSPAASRAPLPPPVGCVPSWFRNSGGGWRNLPCPATPLPCRELARQSERRRERERERNTHSRIRKLVFVRHRLGRPVDLSFPRLALAGWGSPLARV